MGLPHGRTNNPNGRPKGSTNDYARMLHDEFKRIGKDKGKTLITHAVEQAYVDNAVLASLLKKMIPDMSHLDIETQKGLLIKIVEDYQPSKKDELKK